MNLQAILIDDEPASIHLLTDCLNQPEVTVTIQDTAHSVDEGIRKIRLLRPDVVFLDVQMPGQTGMDLLQQYPLRDFEVVIVSAHERFALDAYRNQAFHYLLKPFARDEVIETVQRIVQKQAGQEALRQQKEQHSESSADSTGRISIHAQHGTHVLATTDIIRCEADGSYTEIHLKNGNRIVASQPIKYFEAQLTSRGFLRVHKSHLVNLQEIEFVDHNGAVQLRDHQTSIQVALRKRKQLMHRLTQGK